MRIEFYFVITSAWKMGQNGSCLKRTADAVEEALEDMAENAPGDQQEPKPQDIAENSDDGKPIELNLEDINPDDVPKLPHENQMVEAKIFQVYDGDSCYALFMYGDKPMKTAIRVLGVDCPELKPRVDDEELKALEKAAGIVCRDYVASLILDKKVKIKMTKHDKYGGRILAHIYVDHEGAEFDIADLLVQGNYARPYHGEKKEPWTREELTSAPFVVDNSNQ